MLHELQKGDVSELNRKLIIGYNHKECSPYLYKCGIAFRTKNKEVYGNFQKYFEEEGLSHRVLIFPEDKLPRLVMRDIHSYMHVDYIKNEVSSKGRMKK